MGSICIIYARELGVTNFILDTNVQGKENYGEFLDSSISRNARHLYMRNIKNQTQRD